MASTVEFAVGAAKQLRKLDRQAAERILSFLQNRIAPLGDPRDIGEALHGNELGHLWKYRVGDYRIIASIEDAVATILVVRIGHRREVYRR